MKVRINTTKHTGKGREDFEEDFSRQTKVAKDDSSILQKFYQMNKTIQRVVIGSSGHGGGDSIMKEQEVRVA